MAERRLSVLIVDDDEDDCLLVRKMLDQCPGMKVAASWAPSAERAQAELGRAAFDVVLVDYRLGATDGISLIEELHGTVEAPMILLTGQGGLSVDQQAMSAGAADYLGKDELNAYSLERAIRYALERKRAQEQMTRLALYDSLTGLANRTLFSDRLALEMSRARRYGLEFFVAFIDLDLFKHINDGHGHSAGDDLLREVARRLKEQLRDSDTAARLGGDEFALLLVGDGGEAEATEVAKRVLRAIRAPMALDGRVSVLTASAGLARFPADAQSAEDLIRYADIAMYEAKQGGKDRLCLFKAEMAVRASEKARLEPLLRSALAQHEFTLVYQPVIGLDTRAVVGVEALLRWRRDADLVGPESFIGVLEETQLIIDVGRWVLFEALRQFSAWAIAYPELTRFAVNVSSVQLHARGFTADLARALAESGLPPERLELEITETALLRDPEWTGKVLREVVDSGAKVALDDFGTGFSSLSFLRQFPVSTIKIDRSFVTGMTRRPVDAALTRAVIGIGNCLGLRVIAEGVEHESELEWLLQFGCPLAQGFLFARPLEAAAIPPALAQVAAELSGRAARREEAR